MPIDKFAHISALRPPKEVRTENGLSSLRERRDGRLLRLLGAELRDTERGRHLAVTARFPSSAPANMSSRALRLLAPNAQTDDADFRRWVFLDTETTGLAGGTGTYAFLVGVAWWEQDQFIVEQLFMRDHGEEASLLSDLAQRLIGKRVLVTFNGKSFDWPLLETRYRMTRTVRTESPAVHLDLLHPSRQLWRLRLKSVALGELERHVLDFDRGPDIPSHTIPGRYFDYLRGGPEGPIAEVFRHNQMDLRGLAVLASRIASLLQELEDCTGDAGELFGVSRLMHRRGERVLAEQSYRRALDHGLPETAERIARRELALMARRQGDFDRANALWEDLLCDSGEGFHAYEQLAIHYEHRTHDRERALELTREALQKLQEGYEAQRVDLLQYRRWRAAFQHRLSRLLKR
jgi:uncharacterized protein YprB with RNaseH-like and TPR domain